MTAPDRRSIKKSLRTDFDPSLKLRAIRARHRVRQGLHSPLLITRKELDRPIFIIGAPRSGTSLLYAVLRSSSRTGHWPGEAHEVWEAEHHPALRGWSSNALEADDATPEVAARIKRAFILTVGSKRLIEKTPRNTMRIPFLEALFPGARYVYLKRDGRENVNSLINAWRTPRYRTYRLPQPHSIEGVDPAWWKFVLYPGWEADAHGPLEVVAAKQWIASNEHALRDRELVTPERWLEVSYEDFIAAPTEETRRIFRFLDLPFEPAVERKAAAIDKTPINTVTPPESGKWKRENPVEIAAISDLIAATMNKLGYSLED